MMINISRQFYESLDEKELSYECIKPVILPIRGKDRKAKAKAYSELNVSRKAVFSFHVFYQHAKNSAEELVFLVKNYIDSGFWKEIKKGVQYFRNMDLLLHLKRMEKQIVECGIFDEELFRRFLVLSDEHLLIMGKDIRLNTGKYVSIEEGT